MLLFVMMAAWGCATREPAPVAVQGVLDLSGWDFDRDGSTELKGQWAFYRDQLLAPADFHGGAERVEQLVTLPGLWSSHAKDGVTMPPRGVATYRLMVRVEKNPSRLALMISRPLSVVKIWVNGRLIGQTGEVGTGKDAESPRDHFLFVSFDNPSDTLDIVLQMSNFHNVQGGLNDPILIGSEVKLQQSVWQSHIVTALLCGSLLIMGVIHLLLYLLRPSRPANLFFGLYCLMQSICRMSGDMRVCLLEIVFPDLPWRAGIDLVIMPMTLSVPLLVMFYQALFPWKYGRVAEWLYGIAAAGLLLYVVLTPPNAYDPVLNIFIAVSLSAFLYLFSRFIIDLAQKRHGVGILVPGFLMLAIGMLIDIFFEQHIFETLRLVPFAMLFFVLSYSFLISVRYKQTFVRLATLSAKLEQNNMELNREIRRKESALQRERRERLEKLRYQFNPHFLFNALTSIRGAILKDRDAARNMVSQLSEFCRMALSGERMSILCVDEEIETVRHYLVMEQMRLGDYLSLAITVEPAAEKAKLPAFILNPLVENAVKYGSRTSPDALAVEVRVTLSAAGRLQVTICNTGSWVDPETADENESTGTGLKNVRERLEQCYGDTFRFDVDANHGRVCIQLDLPGTPPEGQEGP